MSETVRSLPFLSSKEHDDVRQKALAPIIIFGFLSLLVSFWFFSEGVNADATSLVGDQSNILAICAKKDFPNSLTADEMVSDTRNVDFYTPLFIDALRLLSRPNANYLRGLNIMLLLTSLLYFWGWWLLFSVWGDRWSAIFLAFIVRGIMYPPGYELWGIAGLWTMLPRTLFLALVPFVLWAWFRWRSTYVGWFAVFLGAGVLVNIHPISGVCVSAALLIAEATWTLTETRRARPVILRLIVGAAVILLGMLPFVWTYASKLGSAKSVNPVEFEAALRMRIEPFFWDPLLYAKLWLRPKWAILVSLPWVVSLLLPRRLLREHRTAVIALGAFALTCILTALLPFPVEWVLKKAGFDVRFSFQFVRTGKYVLIPTILLAGLLLVIGIRELTTRTRYGSRLAFLLLTALLTATVFSRHPSFDRIPILGDDVSRFLWPGKLNSEGESEPPTPINPMLRWVKENTADDATFIGPRTLTSLALRSVVHDWKGAVILIEGNPQAFVEAARKESLLRTPEYRQRTRRVQLFADWGADYWLTRYYVPELPISHAESGWVLYDLRGLAGKNHKSNQDAAGQL